MQGSGIRGQVSEKLKAMTGVVNDHITEKESIK